MSTDSSPAARQRTAYTIPGIAHTEQQAADSAPADSVQAATGSAQGRPS